MMASYSPLMSRRARANSLEKAEAKASEPKSMDIKALTFSSYMLVRKAISSSLVWKAKSDHFNTSLQSAYGIDNLYFRLIRIILRHHWHDDDIQILHCSFWFILCSCYVHVMYVSCHVMLCSYHICIMSYREEGFKLDSADNFGISGLLGRGQLLLEKCDLGLKEEKEKECYWYSKSNKDWTNCLKDN